MSSKRAQSGSWLVAGALLAASLGLGCQEKDTGVSKKMVYTGPQVESTNVTTLVSDSARPQIKLGAPVDQMFENGNEIYPKGVTVTFYGEKGTKVVNTLRANYGKFDKSQSLYTVRGNVQVHNVEKNQKMFTEEAFFDQQKALIYTDSAMFVRIETPTQVLTGNGMKANQDFSRYSILHPIGTFTVQPPTDEAPKTPQK